MVLREGDKVKKTKSGIIYEVKKIHDKCVILMSEDGLRIAWINVRDLDLYFSSKSTCAKWD